MKSTRATKRGFEPHKIGSYVRLSTVEEIIECLLKYSCVHFGINVDSGIFTPFETDLGWVVAPPNGKPIGGHAMTATGFWREHGWIQVQQTWGENYGDKGFFFMPVTHFIDYDDFDAWMVTDDPVGPN